MQTQLLDMVCYSTSSEGSTPRASAKLRRVFGLGSALLRCCALNAGERGYGDPCFLRQRPSTEGQDHSHACYQGVVYIGHVVEDPGTGEEVELIEAVPCRRCADSR